MAGPHVRTLKATLGRLGLGLNRRPYDPRLLRLLLSLRGVSSVRTFHECLWVWVHGERVCFDRGIEQGIGWGVGKRRGGEIGEHQRVEEHSALS